MPACRHITSLLAAEPDGALRADELAEIEAHVAACPSCRQQRAVLRAVPAALRDASVHRSEPDAAVEWARLQTRIRKTDSERPAPAAAPWLSRRLIAWSLPVAAALALGLFSSRTGPRAAAPRPEAAVASADYVQADGATSTLVYVDPDSGWLVVWADGAS